MIIRDIQRFFCKVCGFRFSEKNVKYNNQQSEVRQICVSDGEMKNLVRAEIKIKALWESKTGELFNFAWHLKKLGRSDSTIETYTKYLENVGRYSELNDPESVKSGIAGHFTDTATQRTVCCAYDAYIKYVGGQWTKPDYRPEHKLPFIPTDEELRLAVNCGHRTSMIYSRFLYETGARANEAARLEWTDLNRELGKVTIKASKHGNSRILKISDELMNWLFSLPKTQQTVFRKRSKNSRSSAFHGRMQRLAKNHQNPRFKKIHLHTFRHCKALKEFHKTKNILHVKTVLGHKQIKTTMVYLEVYTQLYGDLIPEDYVCETASTVKEAAKLIEQGFEYICEIEGEKMFRKVKA